MTNTTTTSRQVLMALAHVATERESGFENILCRGGRTGQKIHRGSTGSSVLGCGRWVRHHVSAWKVAASPENITRLHQAGRLCEKCFGPREERTEPVVIGKPEPTHLADAIDRDVNDAMHFARKVDEFTADANTADARECLDETILLLRRALQRAEAVTL